MCHWVRTGLYVLVASLAISALSLAQNPLTPGEAESEATALLGKRPDRVETYFLHGRNYVALGLYLPGDVPPDDKTEIWIYSTSQGKNELHQMWHYVAEGQFLPVKFVKLPSQTSPCLLLKEAHGSSVGLVTRLGLYSIDIDQLVWVVYTQNEEFTGRPVISVDEAHASDPSLRAYLISWGHAHQLDEPGISPDPSDLVNAEQAWINDNKGYTKSATIKLRYYTALTSRKAVGPITAGDRRFCAYLV